MDNVLLGGMSFTTDNKFVMMNYTIKNLNINGDIEIPIDDYTKAIGSEGLLGVKKLLVKILGTKINEMLASMEIEGK